MTKKNEEKNEEMVKETVEKQAEETNIDSKKKGVGLKKKEDKELLKIIELENEIVTLNEKIIGLTNEYYKAYADAENTKKRLQQEFANKSKYMIQSFATEMLPVIDNLERALENADTESAIYVGVNMVHQQLISALKKEGVEEIEALGLDFDPNFHHAILTETKEGVKANMVIEVLQKGYKLKDRILRAALVKVSE